MARRKRKALPLIGAAGLLAATSASANAPAIEPEHSNSKTLILAEEEIFDVSLSTFYVFDRERPTRLAAGRCGGCGGCGGHGGGCGGGGCAHAGGCAHGGLGGCGGCAHGGGCGHGCGGGRGCRGCGGCAGLGLGFGLGILGGCSGCGGGCGSCYTWDPFLQQWVYSC